MLHGLNILYALYGILRTFESGLACNSAAFQRYHNNHKEKIKQAEQETGDVKKSLNEV
jgi:hypothetical protein